MVYEKMGMMTRKYINWQNGNYIFEMRRNFTKRILANDKINNTREITNDDAG
jgi:hypothetical protein